MNGAVWLTLWKTFFFPVFVLRGSFAFTSGEFTGSAYQCGDPDLRAFLTLALPSDHLKWFCWHWVLISICHRVKLNMGILIAVVLKAPHEAQLDLKIRGTSVHSYVHPHANPDARLL